MIVAGKAAVVRGSPQRVDERIQPVADAELNVGLNHQETPPWMSKL